MRPLLVWAVLALTVLAGCTESDNGAKDPEASDDGSMASTGASGDEDEAPRFDLEAGVDAPVWQVGDWWHYQGVYESGETFDTRIVVYAEDGSNYYVTAEDSDLILRAAITHYPTFGRVGKADQGQDIHAQPVSYVRFPMKEQSWDAPFRDFSASYRTTIADLETPKGAVPGYTTVMVDQADGLARIAHGWSPVVKWFTNFTFDFDGVAPPDVTYTLQDWGTNHTGTVPVLEIIDGAHRLFTAVGPAPPNPANPTGAIPSQPPPAQDTMTVEQAGSDLLIAMFAAAGGAGSFDFRATSAEDPSKAYALTWQPTAAGGFFAWALHPDVPTGDYHILGEGIAPFFAFLFGESYEIRMSEATLPAA